MARDHESEGLANALTNAAREKVRQIVAKVEKLREERQEISDEITDCFKEAKALGFDGAAIREIVMERAKKNKLGGKYAEREDMKDLYRLALGMI